MANHQIWRRIRLSDNHRPSGKTRHIRGGKECPTAAELRIIQFPDDPGFYLIHFDDSGAEITDTYHESIEQAQAQAEFEFNIRPDEWE